MALEDKLDHVLNLIEAASQRQNALRDLTHKLRNANLWRSPDGRVVLDASPEQRQEMKAGIEAYVRDLENITEGIRAALAGPPGSDG